MSSRLDSTGDTPWRITCRDTRCVRAATTDTMRKIRLRRLGYSRMPDAAAHPGSSMKNRRSSMQSTFACPSCGTEKQKARPLTGNLAKERAESKQRVRKTGLEKH